MLERIALHQTRLRTPGLGLEGKGVALGAKGLVLLPSLDRLVAWLSVYTREHSLEDLMASLQIQIVKSKLGTKEITLSFAAESADRMEHGIAEVIRKGDKVTYDLKPTRDDPSAVGTSEFADAVIEEMNV